MTLWVVTCPTLAKNATGELASFFKTRLPLNVTDYGKYHYLQAGLITLNKGTV